VKRLLAALFLSAWQLAAANGPGPVVTGRDASTGLKYWQWEAQGVRFRLTHRLPDQTRAFLLARGFDRDTAEFVATNCVFQSEFRNVAPAGSGSVSFDLAEWRVRHGGGEHGLLTREYWREALARRALGQSARIAFEWGLLPTRQTYAPGDYNWGITVYGLPPGTPFDLTFVWRRDGRRFEGIMQGLDCPPDIHPEPGELPG
jgi:hypothetical protein